MPTQTYKTITASVTVPQEYLDNIAVARRFENYVTQTQAVINQATTQNENLDAEIATVNANEELSSEQKTEQIAQIETRRQTLPTLKTKDEFVFDTVKQVLDQSLAQLNSEVTRHLVQEASQPLETAGREAEEAIKQGLELTIE